MKNKVFDFEIATPSEQCMKKKIGPELNLYADLLLILPDFCPQEEKEIWNSFWSFNALWKEHLLIVIESFYVGRFGQLHNT